MNNKLKKKMTDEVIKKVVTGSGGIPMNPILLKFYLICAAVIVVIVIGIIVWFVVDMNNTADSYRDLSYSLDTTNNKSKDQFVTEWNQSKEVSGNNTSVDKSTSVNIKGDGKLVTDIAKNPLNLPIYDGYTMSGAYSDIDYTKFHGDTYSNSNMHGLGDFTNIGARNSVSYEFASDNPVVSRPEGSKYIRSDPTIKEISGYWTVDGRIICALPPGSMIASDIYEPMIQTHWANEAKYTDRSSWTGGAPALSYVSKIFDNSLLGMYVDCILADGTVIALIVTDTKALHKGTYKGKEICQDYMMEGYAHRRAYLDGRLAYNGIIEVAITQSRKVGWAPKDNLNLSNNKINGFRIYTGIRHFNPNDLTKFENHFTE